MEWGFDVTEDTLRLCYGSETWYDDTAAFSETIKREEGQYIAKGDVLWHIDGRQATRHRGTSKQHYTFEEPGPTTASEDALYVCNGKKCFMASNSSVDLHKTFKTPPLNIIFSEAGLLYRTMHGVYTPSEQFLAREIDLYDTHEGVFVGVTNWGMKIWFTASWQMHHRITLPGKAEDVSCTMPWVCVVTKKNTCTIWNMRTGEAYRQWSIHRPRAVCIDHAAQVTACTHDDISFFDDTGTCLYARKMQPERVLTSNDSMWTFSDDIKRMRCVHTWSLQVCMWCETPLSIPFPAPPSFVSRPLEDILDALKTYWIPRSFENLASERATPHLLDFTQIVDLNAWAEAFFGHAGRCDWTLPQARKTRRRLLEMHIPIDVRTWANVENRGPSDLSFQLWDLLYDDIDESCVDVIELACTHKKDMWLASRAEQSALHLVHPYLISFLPLDKFINIMQPKWDKWVPIFLEWIMENQTLTSRRMWRRFLKHLSIHGPVTYFPQVLRTMDALSVWKYGNHDASCMEIEDMYSFDPSFHPTRPEFEDQLLDTPDVLKEHVDVLMNIATPLVEQIYEWNVDMTRPRHIAVMRHEEILVWSEDRLYRRNNNTCTATSNEIGSASDVDVFDDQVCEVHDDCINIYTLGIVDVVYSFPKRGILSACYTNKKHIWVLSIHGVLECIHAVNGTTLYVERSLFMYPKYMKRYESTLYIVCSDTIHVFDTETNASVRSINAAHVIDVTCLFGKTAIIYEDNSVCYEDRFEPLLTSNFRPCYVREFDYHVFVVTTVKIMVFNTMWEKIYEYEFPSLVANVTFCDYVMYVLLRDGSVMALKWNRAHLARAQMILFNLCELDVQRHAEKVIGMIMQDTSIYDDIQYVQVLEKIMKDRTKWPILLREDVFRWLLSVFFKYPTETWTPLWRLFSFRGTTVKCVVCQSTTVSSEDPLVLLQCGHRFHKSCIERLRASHNSRNEQLLQEYALNAALTCPCCRAPLSTPYEDRECTFLATYDSDEEA